MVLSKILSQMAEHNEIKLSIVLIPGTGWNINGITNDSDNYLLDIEITNFTIPGKFMQMPKVILPHTTGPIYFVPNEPISDDMLEQAEKAETQINVHLIPANEMILIVDHVNKLRQAKEKTLDKLAKFGKMNR